MANDKLLPVEERFRMLMGNIQVGLAVFIASLVLKRETDENGNDAANLYAVFDDAPEKPMFIMKVVREWQASGACPSPSIPMYQNRQP